MKYELRWWATKKEVRKTADGYDQVKIDIGGDTQCADFKSLRDDTIRKLEEMEDYCYIELKVLRLGEDA